jgi:DNA-binding response OmpR family regulator
MGINSEHNTNPKTILLIEDNYDILENLKEFFELEGYKILFVNNGKEGVELAIKFKPDLIICDFIMRQMNGQRVLELILNTKITSAIPFIFCTSMSEKADRTKALNLGASDYIVKPFDLDNLLEKVKEQLRLTNKRKQMILSLDHKPIIRLKDSGNIINEKGLTIQYS